MRLWRAVSFETGFVKGIFCAENGTGIRLAFKKTKLLQPGEEQTLTLNFDAELFAVYHEQRAVWQIDRGEYCLLCGTDSRTTAPCAVVTSPENIILEQCENKLRGERVEEVQNLRSFDFPEKLAVLQLDPGAFDTIKHDYSLNEIVTMYLDYAERQARRGNIMYMKDWVARLDAFLQFNEEEVLHHKGKV